jgi:hypothetical protein
MMTLEYFFLPSAKTPLLIALANERGCTADDLLPGSRLFAVTVSLDFSQHGKRKKCSLSRIDFDQSREKLFCDSG